MRESALSVVYRAFFSLQEHQLKLNELQCTKYLKTAQLPTVEQPTEYPLPTFFLKLSTT